MDIDFFAQKIVCFREHGSFICKIKGDSSLCGLPRAFPDPELCMSTTIKKRMAWYLCKFSLFFLHLTLHWYSVHLTEGGMFSSSIVVNWEPSWPQDGSVSAIIISALLLEWGALDRQKDREINKQTKGATASLAIFSVRGGFHGWGEF